MNRRSFLTVLGVAPAMAVPTAVAAPSPAQFDYGQSIHAPMSDEERKLIDAMDESELRKTFRGIFAKSRLWAMAGRCNAAFTMGACFKNRDYVVDADYVRAMIPRINAGLDEDFEALMSPAMRYGLSLCVDGSCVNPLSIKAFLSTDEDSWCFTYIVPGHSHTGRYYPKVVTTPFV